MNIYLAGGMTGNLAAQWKAIAATHTHTQDVYIYIAGEHPVKNGTLANWQGCNILESYYYLRDNKHFPKLIPHIKNFLLDSGAFTFMSNVRTRVDWDAYVEEYAAFINKWNITHFFELDIDSLVGLHEVERLRDKLERLTNKKPIVVWHKNRGKDYFVSMCKKYPYVAVGGIVTKEIPTKLYERLFPWFIRTAHENGCKIHGLGYTNINGLHRFKFDSVDSTAWLYGNRGGYLYKFKPQDGTMQQIDAPNGMRLKSSAAAMHNFLEWVKFQKYAEINL